MGGKACIFYPHGDLTNLKLCLTENRGGDKQPPKFKPLKDIFTERVGKSSKEDEQIEN